MFSKIIGNKSEKNQEVESSLSVLFLTDLCLTSQWKAPTDHSRQSIVRLNCSYDYKFFTVF